MRSRITCVAIFLALLSGVYAHLYWMAYDCRWLRWIPGWDQDPIGIGFLHALFILPTIGIVALIVAIFHKQLKVPLALPLPALIYATLYGLVFAYFADYQRPPQWMREAFAAYGTQVMNVIFWIAFILTSCTVVGQLKKRKDNNRTKR